MTSAQSYPFYKFQIMRGRVPTGASYFAQKVLITNQMRLTIQFEHIGGHSVNSKACLIQIFCELWSNQFFWQPIEIR